MFQSALRKILPKNSRGDFIYKKIQTRKLGGTAGQTFSGHLRRMFGGELDDPLRQFVTDKRYAKIFVAGVAGEKYTVPTYQTLGTEKQVDDLRLDRFPCIIKPAHLSGPVKACLDAGERFDRAVLKNWLKRSHYRSDREGNYRHVRPGIIVEQFIPGGEHFFPDDYKIFCFNGAAKFIQVDSGRFTDHRQDFYSPQWKKLPFSLVAPSSAESVPPPPALEEMLAVAEKLGRFFSFVRVDMFVCSDGCKVGELTHCPQSGVLTYLSASMDRKLAAFFHDPNADAKDLL